MYFGARILLRFVFHFIVILYTVCITLENRIQAMGAEISNLKRELARARRLRSQREQYELIAAEINKYPSTTDTQR